MKDFPVKHFLYLFNRGLTPLGLVTFVIYATDKSAARSGGWRTRERTLHIFSLIGGWPGAAIAQSYLRHKSKKVKFRAVYWVTVIVNCGILVLLLTPEGAHQLEAIVKSINSGR